MNTALDGVREDGRQKNGRLRMKGNQNRIRIPEPLGGIYRTPWAKGAEEESTLPVSAHYGKMGSEATRPEREFTSTHSGKFSRLDPGVG